MSHTPAWTNSQQAMTMYNTDQSRGAQQPFESAHPRHGNADQRSQYDDGEQVVSLRPVGPREEVLGQDIVDDRGMNFYPGIHGAEGGAPQVMGAHGGGPNQHDFVGKCPSGELAAEDIADGNMRKSFRGAQVVNEQLPIFVGGDKPVAHLYPFHPVAPNLHRQLRLSQVVPGTQDRQRRKEILAALDDKRHPAHDTILITPQTEIA